MKILVLVIGVVFLAVIAVLEIWKRLVPAKSKLVKKIEITLVILMFVGGAVGLMELTGNTSKPDFSTTQCSALLRSK